MQLQTKTFRISSLSKNIAEPELSVALKDFSPFKVSILDEETIIEFQNLQKADRFFSAFDEGNIEILKGTHIVGLEEGILQIQECEMGSEGLKSIHDEDSNQENQNDNYNELKIEDASSMENNTHNCEKQDTESNLFSTGENFNNQNLAEQLQIQRTASNQNLNIISFNSNSNNTYLDKQQFGTRFVEMGGISKIDSNVKIDREMGKNSEEIEQSEGIILQDMENSISEKQQKQLQLVEKNEIVSQKKESLNQKQTFKIIAEQISNKNIEAQIEEKGQFFTSKIHTQKEIHYENSFLNTQARLKHKQVDKAVSYFWIAVLVSFASYLLIL